MANGAGGIAASVASVIGSLTPSQTLLLGGHLTSSTAGKAMQYLAAMTANPANAGTFLSLLGQLPSLPPQVMTFASAAVGLGVASPAGQQNITEAESALQGVLASENAIQQAFGI